MVASGLNTRIFFYRRWLTLAACSMLLAACSETQFLVHTAKRMTNVQKGGAASGQGVYKVGDPYQIKGVWYRPTENYNYVETGISSWYGPKFHGKKTANGEIYNMNAMTAAHRTLPMPSYVRVTNLENGRSLILKVNDRGPFAHNRIIDVSRRGAQLLGYENQGTARVRVQILANESRAIKARYKGETDLATVGTPIIVNRLPKPTVSSAPLALPPGGQVAALAPAPPSSVQPSPLEPAATPITEPKLGELSVTPVTSTRLYVQAGAYGRHDSANKVRATLSRLGDAGISRVLVNGRDLFRVRLGPMADVSKADQILEWVIQAGYNGARIIVD